MRKQERGMGNLPFIAVLVLFVVAVALFFVARDEADTAQEELARTNQRLAEAGDQLISARYAYDAAIEVYGFKDNALNRTGENGYPKPDDIKNTLQAWLMKRAGEINQASEANLIGRRYNVDGGTNEVKVIKGDTTQIILYHTTFTQQNVTVQAVLAPLDAQFTFAAKVMQEVNRQFEAASDAYDGRMGEHQTKYDTMNSNFNRDMADKQSQVDTITNDKNQVLDQVNNLTAQNDSLQSRLSQVEAEAAKLKADLERKIRSLEDRIRNMKQTQEIALKEDPKDGEVLVADARKGVVYVNLGRRNRLSAGTRFQVWRAGKGNRRENVAVILVTKVDRTSAEARIIKQADARVPVTAGMNISNPFYDPTKTLRVYIYGDLMQYPTEVARKRLAQAGMQIASTLDESVDIIVLGEPPVAAGEGEEAGDEEGGGAAAMRRAKIEREKRVKEIEDVAKTIGALVVTEDVLRTFIEY